MAKKNNELIDSTISDLQSKLDNFLQVTQKFTSGTQEFDTIPTGIRPLDLILGGGIALGSIAMLVGRPGSGKSSLAANIMGAFQRESNGKSLCVYVDSEQAMTSVRLAQLGVISPKIKPYQNLTVEDVFKSIDSIIAFKVENKCVDTPCVIVWDSLANTLTEKETHAHDPKEVLGFKARILSLHIPNYASKINKYKITLIIVNQLRDNVSLSLVPNPQQIRGMRQSENIPGGRAILYNTNQLIYLADVSDLKEETFGFSGKEIDCYCIKNKLFIPKIHTRLTFSFMTGYSDIWSMVSMLKVNKVIVTKGAWLNMEGYPKNFQNKKIIELYTNDPLFKQTMDNLFKKYNEDLKAKYELEMNNSNPLIKADIAPVVKSISETNSKDTPPPPPKQKVSNQEEEITINLDENQ